ncbi:hypothetical protein OG542_16910 [Streptomyces violaceus]|uniref:hypothetical protein n=1 Tax=Streptomyces violaceus TaxID=1936 RepID=UPI0030E01D99
MLSVVTAPSRYVLAIEAAGPSTAMVTSRTPQHLDQLVGDVAGALENPDTEFQVTVEQLTINSPTNYHFGDNVNMHGGSGNTGIVKNGATGDSLDPTLRRAMAELLQGVRELREQLPQPSAQLIDESLPVLSADAVPQEERRRALMAVAAIAAAVGAVGQPVAEAANRILQMLSGQ